MNRRTGWLVPFAIGLLVRIGLITALHQSGAGEGWDAMGYHERGLGFWQSLVDLAHGGLPTFEHMDRAYTSYYPPFQMVVLGLGIGAFGESLFASRLTMVLLGVATIPLVHRVTRHRFGEHAAFWAASLAAVYPVLVYHSIGTRSETTYIFLLFAIVALADTLLDRIEAGGSWRKFAGLLGVAVGLAILTRTVGLPLLVLVPAWLAWAGREWAPTRRAALTVAAVATLTLLPWEATVSFVEKRPVLLSIGDTHNVGVGEPIDRAQRQAEIAGLLTELAAVSAAPPTRRIDLQEPVLRLERPLDGIPWSLGFAAWRNDPAGSLVHGLRHWWLLTGVDGLMARQFLAAVFPPTTAGFVSFVLCAALVAQLVFWGFVAAGVRAARASPQNLLLAGMVAAGLAVHFFFGREAKYAVPLQALLLPLAGYGISQLRAHARGSASGRLVAVFATVALALSTITATRAAFAHEVRAASSWYAAQVRGVNDWVVGSLPVSDRFLVRSLAGARAPLELRLVGDGAEFANGGKTRTFRPQVDPIRSFVTVAGRAAEPVRIELGAADHVIAPHPDRWQTWTAIPELGIEWMWIGGPFVPVYDLQVLALTGEKPALHPAE